MKEICHRENNDYFSRHNDNRVKQIYYFLFFSRTELKHVDPINKHLDSRSRWEITPAALVLRNRLEDGVLMSMMSCRVGGWDVDEVMSGSVITGDWHGSPHESRERDNLMTAYPGAQLISSSQQPIIQLRSRSRSWWWDDAGGREERDILMCIRLVDEQEFQSKTHHDLIYISSS